MTEEKTERIEKKEIEKPEEKKIDVSKEEKNIKTEEAKTGMQKKVEEKKIRDKAIVRGKDIGISTKHAVAICNFIRGRKISDAIEYLKQVVKRKKVMPMKGEIPHRKGKVMSGRYPVNASEAMIKLLKSLDANARAFEIITPKIIIAKADKASSPYRRFGSRRFKRTHVFLMAESSQSTGGKK